MKKVSFIFGTGPEAIKLWPSVLALQKHPEFQPHVRVAAEHRAMLDQVLEVSGVAPDNADIVLDTTELSPEECVQEIVLHLEKEGYIGPNGQFWIV